MQIIFQILGLVVFLKGLWALVEFVKIYTTKLDQNWAKKYGEKSWSIVTGCTEGIGKAFCFQLVKLKFNVVLISRNQQKLDNLRNEIISTYPSAQLKVIIADFSIHGEQFYRGIFEHIKDLDISLLVNNVGMSQIKILHQQSSKEIEDQLHINIDSMTFLSQKIIPKMLERKAFKSGIINLSSHSITCPFKNLSVYTATKAYNDLFSRCLSEDYRNQIDVISCRPCIVSSAGTNYTSDAMSCTSEDCARGTLKALGKIDVTEGHWTHVLQSWSSTILGQSLTRWFGNMKLRQIQKSKRQ